MKKFGWMIAGGTFLLAFSMMLEGDGAKVVGLITGQAAFVDTKDLKPGTFRKITVADLPAPGDAHPGFGKNSPRPEGTMPQAPAGFKVELYAKDDLKAPRQIRTAPNGDLFVAEETAGNIKVIHDNNGKPEVSTFATGLAIPRVGGPFGIAFYPVGPNPQWVYVGNTGSIVRFPYKNGDLKASGMMETLVSDIQPGGDHKTRDVVFTKDGKNMLVAVGSADNVSQSKAVQEHRANVLEYRPEGKFVKIYASGIRNPVGLAINPATGELWTSVNERDNLGNNLVPDYITSVKEDGFYGWPWFYIGQHEDPRAKADFDGKDKETLPRPSDKTIDKVIVPDVLIQAHSASLGLTFYTGTQFPAEYRGDIFAAEHGSWNRTPASGREVVRVPLTKGKSDGVYEDFLTGFDLPDGSSWGRVTGVAVGKDGALYVSDDQSNSIWKVSYVGAGK
jgi:glucose/arabinose dehydrogenase